MTECKLTYKVKNTFKDYVDAVGKRTGVSVNSNGKVSLKGTNYP